MEDSNLFVNLNEFESESFIFSNQFNYQAQPSPKIFQLQGSYQDQYTDKQSINCQQQMSDIKGHGLPTMSNYPLEQTLTHSNNIRSESEFQCSPKAISATVKKSSPNGIASCKKREVDRFSKFIPFEKRILKFQLPLYCPVQNCRHNLTKFYKRYSLLKHCFQAHVHYGKPYKKLSIQEQTILTLIIPHCATCDRLFSRNDSLKRHLRQLHN